MTKTDEIEHHPSCKDRCVADCDVSPRRPHDPWEVAIGTADFAATGGMLLLSRRAQIRTLHTDAVAPLLRAPAPLWERTDDWDAARASGVEVTPPESYIAFERADERYSLDRWTRPDGLKDRELDAIHAAQKAERRNHARTAPDVAEVALQIREWFPGVDLIRARRKDTREAVCEHVFGHGGVYVGIVWALALVLFDRERDPITEHAIGRMLPGEPVSETRAPFASAGHLMAVASHELRGLGGGGSAWPQEDPRMARRTWAKGDEMKVSGAHHGNDRIKGEGGVHRILDARNVARRAVLSPAECAMVEVLSERGLTRDERLTALREVEARRRGIDPETLVTPETARLQALAPLTAEADAAEGRAIEEAHERGENVKARREAHELRMGRIKSRREADAAYRAQGLRKATEDVSDRELLQQAKAAERRVREAAERVSGAGDAVMPKRAEASRRPRALAVAHAGYADA